MATILRQSTQIKVRIGPAVAVANGYVPVTTLSLSSADEAELLKGNGAATVDISGATFAAVTGADGWYDLTLTTSHTDTVGELVVVVNDDSLILPIYQRFQVIEEAIYDAMFAASAAVIPANVTQWLGTAPATPNTAGIPKVDPTLLDGDATAVDGLVNAGNHYYTNGHLNTVHVVANGTVDTVNSQTSIVLASDPVTHLTDNGYVGAMAVFRLPANNSVAGWALINGWTRSTLTLTLAAAPAGYTIQASDIVDVVAVPKQLPSAAASASGGLGTVDANNYIAGVQGTINTLDGLDTAQDTQHSTTQGKVDTAQADLDILTGADGVVIASGTQTFNMTGNITGNLSGSVGSVTGAVGSVTGNVGGNVTGSVGSISGITFPTNFSSLVISAGGAVDALMQGFLNTLVTETSAGRIAGNFSTFYDNADAATAQTVDDVGGGGGAGDASQATLLLVKAQTDLINTSGVTVIDTVGGGTHITVVRGDTFPSSEADPGTALTFTKASGEKWPDDLSASWTITMTWRVNTSNVVGTAGSTTSTAATATIVTATGASQAVKFNDLTAADMAGLSVGAHVYDFDIQALNGTKRVTLRTGTVTVIADQTLT